jgi:hypothetical protein
LVVAICSVGWNRPGGRYAASGAETEIGSAGSGEEGGILVMTACRPVQAQLPNKYRRWKPLVALQAILDSGEVKTRQVFMA